MRGYAWKIMLEEMNKCVVLCCNCHRKRTTIENGWFRSKN